MFVPPQAVCVCYFGFVVFLVWLTSYDAESTQCNLAIIIEIAIAIGAKVT